jgi:glutathione S-transferase
MQLYYTERSPYARLVRAVAHARGVELELVNPGHPLHDPVALHQANPLGKIPCLQLADGTWLHDSRVILAYLDMQGTLPPMLPQTIAEHNLLALGYGLLDAAVNIAMETFREAPSDDYMARQSAKLERTLAHIEAMAPQLSTTASVASLSVAIAYIYLSFRLPLLSALIANTRYPALDAWARTMQTLPAMLATEPKE